MDGWMDGMDGEAKARWAMAAGLWIGRYASARWDLQREEVAIPFPELGESVSKTGSREAGISQHS